MAFALGLLATLVIAAFGDHTPVRTAAQEAISSARRKIGVEWRKAGIPGNSRALSCLVDFAIAADGSLTEASIRQSSGNDDFDQSCLVAIAAAAPFTEVADALKSRSLPIKIRLRFQDSEAAEPGATDNPDDAQRLREDH